MNRYNSLISIVIPVFNREKYIVESIYSALSQSYANVEVVVVDNCSTDNTWEVINEIAAKDNRVKVFRNQSNLGPVLNWEQCLLNAKGEFLKILWSDDLLDKNYLEKAISIFYKDVAFVISGYDIFDDSTKRILYRSTFNSKNYDVDFYIKQNILYNAIDFPVSPGSSIFRKVDIDSCLIKDIQNLDNIDFKKTGAGNDLLLMLLVAVKYPSSKIACLNENLSMFRAHENSISIENRLDLNYEYARDYFVINHGKNLSSLYKVRLFLKKIINKKYSNIYLQHTISQFTFFNAITYLIIKIWYKLYYKLRIFLRPRINA